MKQKDDTFNFDLIERYFLKKDKSASFQVVSDKTCNDLDFQEFFMFADRTTSRVGQQYFYNKLRTIDNTGDHFSVQEKLINEIDKNTDLRVELQYQLNKLGKSDAFYISSLFLDEHIQPPKWFFLTRVMTFISLVTCILTAFNSLFFLVMIAVFLVNAGFHYWNKRNLFEYLSSVPQLLKLNGAAKELIKHELFKTSFKELPGSVKTIDKVRNRMMFFKLEAKLDSDAEVIFWAMLELFKILFLLEPLLLFGVLKQLDRKRKEIENVFSFVGYVDSLISIISLRKSLTTYCIPEFNTIDKAFGGQDIYHPLLPYCIPNTIWTENKSVLLTGSNMSGKTTFIRSIGLNVIAALTLNTCFATQFKLPVLRTYSAIRISDDLMNDKSYYFQEVLTIKDMIDKSKEGNFNLFLLDEIFKGTNTIERISAGKSVLSALNNERNIVFVSTHDIELTDMLNEEFDLYHFSEQVDNQTVDFDYKLKPGKLKNRNAIRILKLNGYPDSVISEAMEIANRLDKISTENTSKTNSTTR